MQKQDSLMRDFLLHLQFLHYLFIFKALGNLGSDGCGFLGTRTIRMKTGGGGQDVSCLGQIAYRNFFFVIKLDGYLRVIF